MVHARLSVGIVVVVAVLWHTPAWSQGVRTPAGPGRRTTTLTALATYPLFFNGQPVRVRAAAREENGLFSLEDGGTRVWLVAGPNGRLPDAKSTSDVYGVFFDVGRLDPGDQRATGDFGSLSQRVLNRPTPNPGELLVILVDRSEQAETLSAPSVRNVALDPNRYVDQEVTVVGRFRGRNLYGDLPDAPGKSRWDFVLQSADCGGVGDGAPPAWRRLRPEHRQPRRHRPMAGSRRRRQSASAGSCVSRPRPSARVSPRRRARPKRW